MSRGSLPKRVVVAFGCYLKRHPEELLRAVRNAAAFKIGVPVRALSWLAKELGGNKVPEDLVLEARSPGIFASASFDLMKTPLHGSATIIVESVDMSSDALLVGLRFEDIHLKVTEDNVGTPVAALLQAGALDLSRPGDLLAYMPLKSEILVGAKGNVITLDLMKHPKLSQERARKLVALLVPLIGVESIRTDGEHLDIGFSALPRGPQEAFEQIRSLF
jgi:hypothetical protein